jgi:predicted ArsR family transcriptional regulator
MGPSGGGEQAVSSAQDRLLEILAGMREPATLAQLAEASGLHENTVRVHLDGLRERGRVTRLKDASSVRGRGRPAWTYVARQAPYAALAEALAAGLELGGDLTTSDAATRGGRAWGERLTAHLGLQQAEPMERVLLTLEHVGFKPEVGDDGTVRLTHCPFLDAAHAHPEAVCNVHRGLVEGALGGSIDDDSLRPFAEPGACVVHLPTLDQSQDDT